MMSHSEQCEVILTQAFLNAPVLKVVIPNSVTKIEANAFSDCSTLSSVTIGDSIAEIGIYASLMPSLISINLQDIYRASAFMRSNTPLAPLI